MRRHSSRSKAPGSTKRPESAAVTYKAFGACVGTATANRFGEFEADVEGITKQRGVEVHDTSGPVEDLPRFFDVIPHARQFAALGLELLARRSLEGAGLLRRFEPLRGLRVDATVHDLAEPIQEDRADRSELALNHVDLLDKLPEDDVLGAIGVDEIMAPDFRLGLQRPIDAPVTLLDSGGVPGHVEVEKVRAMALQVHAFTSRVGRDQNANGVLVGRRVERALDLFALLVGHPAVQLQDARFRAFGPVDGGVEDGAEIPFRVPGTVAGPKRLGRRRDRKAPR
jgi:hypothetical protein